MDNPLFSELDFRQYNLDIDREQYSNEDEKAWIQRIFPSYLKLVDLFEKGHKLTFTEADLLTKNMNLLENHPILILLLWLKINNCANNVFLVHLRMKDLLSRMASREDSPFRQCISLSATDLRNLIEKRYGI